MKTAFLLLIFSAIMSGYKPIKVKEVAIIPQPSEIVNGSGKFSLNKKTVIVAKEDAIPVAQFLKGFLKKGTGFDLPIVPSGSKNAIILSLEGAQTNFEAYQMKSTSKNVIISASSPAGLFYGIQTLRQLFPSETESSAVQAGVEWNIPVVEINDQPRFPWRGMMLDCSRHFFPVSYLKKLLDQMAASKMNRFHWHLVDDQGWRIEIKKYPKLTEVGSGRKETLISKYGVEPKVYDGILYGGFYTQEDVKEIVAYAAKRYITVIPEIEMPGHASAALAAYQELGCTGGPYQVATHWGVFSDVFCVGKDNTFSFLQDVIDEVIPLFPGVYFHIGGDECAKTEWKKCMLCQKRIRDENLKDESELQSYFVKRIEKFLNSKNRTLIGWDEILEGGLAPRATVMSWRGFEGGIAAAKSGHDVVMTPGDFCYFNNAQDPIDPQKPETSDNLTLSKVYEFNPLPDELSAGEAKHILGGQANLWTEFVTSPERSDYMTFPRLAAMAEVLWTVPVKKSYPDFQRRLARQFERYDFEGIDYYKGTH